MQLWQQIEASLVRLLRRDHDDESVESENGEFFFDPLYTAEELNLTALAKELAGAINIKVD